MGRFAILALLLCAHEAHAQPAQPAAAPAAAPAPAPAAADDDDPFANTVEPPQPAEAARAPAPHWLNGRLDGITAKLTVRYHLAAAGPSGFNSFQLVLPDNGVVTGATIVADGVKHRLAFEEAAHGRVQFDAVLGRPARQHRRWAVIVSSTFSTSVKVEVAAPRAAVLTIDLEVDTPTCFSHGVRYVSVSPDWRASIDRTLRTRAAKPEGCVERPNEDGDPGSLKLWIGFPGDDGGWRPPGEQRVVMRGERVDVEHGHFARVEINLASELTQVPADLHTVFVIDASRSMRASELEAQAAVIRSYAQHAPGTEIQIVAFARNAHALLPAWTRAGNAKLSGLATIALANGSNVDTGLVEAAAWLARTTGTRRLVLFGDERLGKRVAGLEASVLRGVLPANTLVHVVALDAKPPPGAASPGRATPPRGESIFRADDIAFAQLARDTEGLAARATTFDGPIDAAKLVRPIALEQVSVHAAGWVAGAIEANEPHCTGDLAEGSACAWYGVDDDRQPELAPSVTVEGLLWNHRVRRTITPDAGHRELLARMLTGFMANLGTAEHDLQVVAHAINEAWVLYGAWGDASGYADQGLSELDSIGCGCDDSSLQGGFGFGNAPTVRMTGPSIAAQLEHATAACHIDARVEIAIELTEHEIVDVAVTAPRADLRDCVTEAVWNTALSVSNPEPHAFETIALGA
jgi:hypothetical protein